MKSQPKKRAVIVGLFIFLGVVFLLAGILAIGDLHNTFVSKITITSILDDANGLQPGNNVWFSGLKIGTVDDLSFHGHSQVKVIMKIDEKSQPFIHKNAKVKIGSDGLIGNKIIVIYGGTSDVAVVEEGDSLGTEKVFTTEDMMNTLQENNKNFLAITADFKAITQKIADGQGTIGKLLNDEALFNTMELTLTSLKKASVHAEQLTASLSSFSSKLNQKGTLANDLVTDTAIVNTLRSTVLELQQISSSAGELITDLKNDMNDSTTPIGVLLNDQQSAVHLKSTIKNLESSSQKLDENLEALQHNFLLRGFFKDKEKSETKQ